MKPTRPVMTLHPDASVSFGCPITAVATLLRPQDNLQLPVAGEEWGPVGGPLGTLDTRLLMTAYVNGLPLHFEAFEVTEVDGLQQPVSDHDAFDAIYTAVGAYGPWQTTLINGRTYVIIATPHCT